MSKVDNNSRKVTDEQEIGNLLRIAQMHRWSFSYSPANSVRAGTHTTELVGIDLVSRNITVGSEVNYSDLKPGEPIFFRAQSGGITIRFESSILAATGSALSIRLFSACRIELPESMIVTQLRRAVRVNFVNIEEIPVTYFSDEGVQFQGRVSDLSTSGAKIQFIGNLAYQFRKSRDISDCQMLLPDESQLEAKVKVRGFMYDSDRDVSYVRCQFMEMAGDNELKLKELIDSTLQNIPGEAVSR